MGPEMKVKLGEEKRRAVLYGLRLGIFWASGGESKVVTNILEGKEPPWSRSGYG